MKPGLTEREQAILVLAGAGFTDKEIAQAVEISVFGVAHRWRSIFEKLAVRTKAGAVGKFYINVPLAQERGSVTMKP